MNPIAVNEYIISYI